jgi:hypothetical protein
MRSEANPNSRPRLFQGEFAHELRLATGLLGGFAMEIINFPEAQAAAADCLLQPDLVRENDGIRRAGFRHRPALPMQACPQTTLRSILWLNSTHGRRKAEAVMLGAERVVASLKELEPDIQRLALEFVFDAFEDALLRRPPPQVPPGCV